MEIFVIVQLDYDMEDCKDDTRQKWLATTNIDLSITGDRRQVL